MMFLLRLLALTVVLLGVGLGGLYYYGASLKPTAAPVEKVIPNDRFPQ